MAKLTDKEIKERQKKHSARHYAKHKESTWAKKPENIERVRTYQAEYRRKNKEKLDAYNKDYREKNKERLRIADREKYHNLDPSKRADVLLSNAKWRKENPEKMNEYRLKWLDKSGSAEKVRSYNKQYRKDNKESNRRQCATRRAVQQDATPSWLIGCEVELKRLHQIYVLCDLFQKADGIPRHVDHMWPLSDGGPHWSGNLQVLTATENLKKGAKVCPIIKKQIQLNLEEERLNGTTN